MHAKPQVRGGRDGEGMVEVGEKGVRREDEKRERGSES